MRCGTVALMHPTDVASAAWVFASAPSKVPFYVAGGLLACWAVIVAATGIAHRDFPGSAGRARLVMLTSVVLVAATLAAAVVTGGGANEEGGAQDGAARSAGAAPTSGTLELAAEPTGRPLYDKDRAAVKAGKVEIRLANASSVPHNVTITRGTQDCGRNQDDQERQHDPDREPAAGRLRLLLLRGRAPRIRDGGRADRELSRPPLPVPIPVSPIRGDSTLPTGPMSLSYVGGRRNGGRNDPLHPEGHGMRNAKWLSGSTLRARARMLRSDRPHRRSDLASLHDRAGSLDDAFRNPSGAAGWASRLSSDRPEVSFLDRRVCGVRRAGR